MREPEEKIDYFSNICFHCNYCEKRRFTLSEIENHIKLFHKDELQSEVLKSD